MQSCPGCDYLVPVAWSECKRCGAALAPVHGEPARPLVAAVASTRCTRPSAMPVVATAMAAATPVSAPVADVRPCERTGARRVRETADREVTAMRRRPRSSGLAAFVALAVVAACGFVAWNKVAHPVVPKELQPWVDHGAGVTFSPTGAGLSVSMPSAPTMRTARVAMGRAPVVTAAIAETTAGDHVVGATWLPTNPLMLTQDPDGPARAAATAAAQAAGFTVDVAELTTWNGRQAIDAEISVPGAQGEALVVADGTRIVAVWVLGTTHGTAGFDHLRHSLSLG